MKRQYSDEEKAACLATLQLYRGHVANAARYLKIPVRTLAHWAEGENQHPDVAKIADIKKANLADLFEEEIRSALGAADGKRGDATYKDTLTGIGILTDKMQLLRGEPTSIHEQYSHLSDAELDARIEEAQRGAPAEAGAET